ncbi:MAG: hypothetical protein JXR42_02530 [Gammaproteobacteria bacterium]|nr:hypothetical protein [Gammaproteobacteria bacterium]
MQIAKKHINLMLVVVLCQREKYRTEQNQELALPDELLQAECLALKHHLQKYLTELAQPKTQQLLLDR